jgi:hypothetical protein
MIKAVRAAILAKEPEYADALAASYDLTFKEREAVINIAARSKFKLPPGAIGPADLYYQFDGEVRLYNPEQKPTPGLATANIDIIWSEPGVIQMRQDGIEIPNGSACIIGEFQLDADASYRPVQHNPPLAAAALLASKWLNVEYVVPAVIVLGPGDAVIQRGRPMSKHDLGAYELQLRQIIADVEQARLTLEQTRNLYFSAGHHCQNCPSSWCCPSYTLQLKQLLDQDHNDSSQPEELDETEARRLVGMLELCESLTSKTRAVLKHYVDRNGNIELDDGSSWGKQLDRYPYLNARIGFDELAKLTGEQLVWRQLQLPMGGLRAALSEAQREGKLTYSVDDAVAMTLWRISEQGGIRKANSTQYRRRYEKVQARPGIETPPEEEAKEGAEPQVDPPVEPVPEPAEEDREEVAG